MSEDTEKEWRALVNTGKENLLAGAATLAALLQATGVAVIFYKPGVIDFTALGLSDDQLKEMVALAHSQVSSGFIRVENHSKLH